MKREDFVSDKAWERYIEERAWSRRQRENQGFWRLAIIVLFFIVALIK